MTQIQASYKLSNTQAIDKFSEASGGAKQANVRLPEASGRVKQANVRLPEASGRMKQANVRFSDCIFKMILPCSKVNYYKLTF